MNDNQMYVAELCRQLVANGKTPSTALIKSASDRPIPLPDILRVLKSWKESPEAVTAQVEASESETESIQLSLEQRVVALEKQVAELQKQLADL